MSNHEPSREALLAENRALRGRVAALAGAGPDLGALFRTLAEHTLVGIHLIQDGRFVYVNPRFAEVFGYTAQELVALPSCLALVVEEDRALVGELLRRRQAGELETAHYTFRGRRRDGAVVDLEVLSSRAEHAGRPAVVGTLLDITDRRRAEAEREGLYQQVVASRQQLHALSRRLLEGQEGERRTLARDLHDQIG
jgi:PAS domain S-box-containing protein